VADLFEKEVTLAKAYLFFGGFLDNLVHTEIKMCTGFLWILYLA
jgi:hypothetical protein